MRNPVNERIDGLMESLLMCGIRGDQVTRSRKYLEKEIDECDIRLEWFLSFDEPGKEVRNDKIFECLEDLEEQEESDLAFRYFELLFQIFGFNMAFIYQETPWIQDKIDPYKKIVFEIESKILSGDYILEYDSILMPGEEKEDIFKAFELCLNYGGASIVDLLTVLFYTGMESDPWNGQPIVTMDGEKKKGLFSRVVSHFIGEFGEAKYFLDTDPMKKYRGYFWIYEDECARIPDYIFGKLLDEQTKQTLRDYIKIGNLHEPVPKHILAPINLVKIDTGVMLISLKRVSVNYRLSAYIYRVLKMFLASVYKDMVLEIMLGVYREDMAEEIYRWKVDFWIPDYFFIKWLVEEHPLLLKKKNSKILYNAIDDVLKKMLKQSPDAFFDVLSQVNRYERGKLIKFIKEENYQPFFGEELEPYLKEQEAMERGEEVSIEDTLDTPKSSASSLHKEYVIDYLIECCYPEMKSKILEYFQGTLGIKAFFGQSVVIPKMENEAVGVVWKYISMQLHDTFLAKAICFVICTVQSDGRYVLCSSMIDHEIRTEYLRTILRDMKTEGFSLEERMKYGAMILALKKTKELEEILDDVFREELLSNKGATLDLIRKKRPYTTFTGIRVLAKDRESYKEEILACMDTQYAFVEESLVETLSANEEWAADLLELFRVTDNYSVRDRIVIILSKYKSFSDHWEELYKMVQEGRSVTYITEPGEMPEVHLAKTGMQVQKEYMQVILLYYICGENNGEIKQEQVRRYTDALKPKDLEAYMAELLRRYIIAMEQNMYPYRKGILYVACIHGGYQVAAAIKEELFKWSIAQDEKKGLKDQERNLAQYAVKALSFNRSLEAFGILDELSVKCRDEVVSQAIRNAIEKIVSEKRRWQVKEWKKEFVTDPDMNAYANGLIWGYYEEEKLLKTFRYMEDGTYNTVDEEE